MAEAVTSIASALCGHAAAPAHSGVKRPDLSELKGVHLDRRETEDCQRRFYPFVVSHQGDQPPEITPANSAAASRRDSAGSSDQMPSPQHAGQFHGTAVAASGRKHVQTRLAHDTGSLGIIAGLRVGGLT